jgi:hypothetical protein
MDSGHLSECFTSPTQPVGVTLQHEQLIHRLG